MDWKQRNKAIIEFYGEEHQKLKLCEECAELIQAILKGNEKGMLEEIADVEVLIDQLKFTNDIGDFIKGRKRYKITRELTRIRQRYLDHSGNVPAWLDECLEGIEEE